MGGEFTEVRGTAHDLQAWHELLTGDAAPFQRIEAAREADGFTGRFWRVVLDQVTVNLIEITASQHTISRTAEHIKALPEPYYLVLFQVRGSSMFWQDGGASPLRAGDFVVTTSTDPYTWEFHGDFATFAMRFPQSFIDLPESVLRPTIGRAIAADHGFAAQLSPFVTAVVCDSGLLRGPLGGRVARNLIDLFGTALYEAVSGEATSRSVPLFLQVTDYISRHLGEPGLETASVARAHHLSVRYLQTIFAEQGTTVTGWIRERRLAGCRRDLADPALFEVPIGDVAARWGYPDQAYFSRLFRRTFDETPREWRARAASLLKVLRLRLRGNASGASGVYCYVRSLLIQDVTIAGLYRRGTGRWGVALAVFIAIALTVGLSAALAMTRIDNGTDASGGLTHIVASVSATAGR